MTQFAVNYSPRHFSADEFDHPELVAPTVIIGADEIRHRLGYRIGVTSDVRHHEDLVEIYGPRENWPGWLRRDGSPHEVREDGYGHALDLAPLRPSDWDEVGDRPWRIERRWRLGQMFAEAFRLHEEGEWPRLGAELGTRHLHVDDDPVLSRPYSWPGESR